MLYLQNTIFEAKNLLKDAFMYGKLILLLYLWYKVAQLGRNVHLENFDDTWPKTSKDRGFVACIATALFASFSSNFVGGVSGFARKKLRNFLAIFIQLVSAVFLVTGMSVWTTH